MKGPIECVVDGGTVKRTVIFSSKICDNVDIEVGKFIRMYPPWYVLYILTFDSIFSALFIPTTFMMSINTLTHNALNMMIM